MNTTTALCQEVGAVLMLLLVLPALVALMVVWDAYAAIGEPSTRR